jgi:hypothetical protein
MEARKCRFSLFYPSIINLTIEYHGGYAAAEEFLTHGVITKALFVNHAKGNSAVEERYNGYSDRLHEEYTDQNITVTVDELVLELSTTPEETMIGDFVSRMDGCTYDAILFVGSFSFELLYEGFLSSGCLRHTLMATFDSGTEIFDAIAVGDLAFAVSQQQHLQGSLSVALASIYATTGKTLAQSSESQFGVYNSGPKIINLENLPTDTEANCEAISFPVCDRVLGDISPDEYSMQSDEISSTTTSPIGDGPGLVEDDRPCPCLDRSKIKIGGVLHAGKRDGDQSEV